MAADTTPDYRNLSFNSTALLVFGNGVAHVLKRKKPHQKEERGFSQMRENLASIREL